jgi:tetratricopeptide (TPR) repeat protein
MLQIAVGLFCVLTAVTLVGHGIWLALEFVFRSLAGGHRTERLPRSLCPRCQQPLWSPESRCLHCAQPTEDTSASEFHDLERALRRIAALQETQALHPKTFRELKECIEARQQALQRQVRPNVHPVVKSTPSIQPVRAENPPVAEPALPLWQQFEKALEVCQDVGDLAVQQRRSLIDWAHDVGAKRRSLLSGKAQLGLARLLRVAGNKQEALAAYRQLLQTHPRFDDGGVAGLEAGRLALQIKSPAEAHDFLEWALGCSLPEEQQLEARRLLETAEKGLPVVELLPEPGPLDGQSNGHHAGRQPIAAALPGAPSAPPPPRRSLVELLAAFMEERNMLWGELVGGLLMVGGSIALVVSLWKTLEGIAYFPFIIFSAITAAIFGAGLYTFHHWKLQSTSRGLLFIGILLVPLDFVVMARLVVEAEGAEAVPRLSIEGLAICLFAFLMKRSTRVLSAGGEWLLVAAVLGASTSPLAIHRIVEYADATGWPFVLLGLWPVVCYCATSAVIVRGARQRQFDEPEVVSLFSFLGLATFPVIVALGFLIYWSGNPGLALGRLAVPVALAGMPILATGLLAHKRLGEPRADGTPQSAALRTAGTTLALTGVTVMLSAVACAWPEPLTILCVCALVFATLTALALIFGPPELWHLWPSAIFQGFIILPGICRALSGIKECACWR